MQNQGRLLSDEEINNFFHLVDNNRDKVIDYREFCAIFSYPTQNTDPIQIVETVDEQPLPQVHNEEDRIPPVPPQTLNPSNSIPDEYIYRTPVKEEKVFAPSSTDFKSSKSTAFKSVKKQSTNPSTYYILQAFYDQIQLEVQVQKIKRELALRYDFSPIVVFQFLDVQELGVLTPREFAQGMECTKIKTYQQSLAFF